MQLAWTALERQAYSDPAFGDVNRKVIVSEPLPTALRSWGNALFPCPCLCRSQGLSKELLLANGLRGIQICSAQRPSFPRHIHSCSFPPFQACLPECRAALCLLGNAVSPIQALWVFAHLWLQVGLCQTEPVETLRHYFQKLRCQEELSWNPISPDGFTATIKDQDGSFEVVCQAGCTVRQRLHAQLVFEQSPQAVGLRCRSLDLPGFACLGPHTYEPIKGHEIDLTTFKSQ